MLEYIPLLILSAMLMAVAATARPSRMVGETSYRIGVWSHVIALAGSLFVLREVSGPGDEAIRLTLVSSPSTGVFQFALTIDRLAAVMMVLISGIGTLIYIFSIRYLQSERGRARFLTLMALTTSALLCMVSSSNLLMLFIFWQLLGWLLYFLSHHYSHRPTVEGAFKTYTVLRTGDIAFLAGIVLAYHVYGTLNFDQLFRRAADMQATLSLWPGGLEISASTVIALLIFVGAMSKSAQFPLHVWLPESLYAPTPITALLHAGIINSGGFLLNRLAPLYGLSPVTLHVVFAVGLITALLGASMMLVQNDIKRTLGYSTIGQMGYMIMECGLGAFGLAIFHLIAHGIFKATVFLNCGNVIHAARREPRLPHPRDPKGESLERGEFSRLTWLTGLIATLILPLIIYLAAHDVLQIPLRDSQGAVVFLFFGWMTSAQAILTLYRLRAVASWKVAAGMLLILLGVILTYLFAAERFTYFLYPSPGRVEGYFRAAALPGSLFDILVAATALLIILGWTLIYAKTHGQRTLIPKWVRQGIQGLQTRLYVLFINRLYLDALTLTVSRGFSRVIRRLDTHRWVPFIIGLVALGAVLPGMAGAENSWSGNVFFVLVAALTLPLFPFHGFYVAVLTRLRGYFPALSAVALPVVGFSILTGALPKVSSQLLEAVTVLALFGAIYGTLKSLAQVHAANRLAYAGLALFSILWWYLGVTGFSTPQAVVYTSAVALVTGGLFLAWHAVRTRYGDLASERIGGLARPMPRFALILSLLVTAAMGLPPFGLFSGYIEILLSPSVSISWDLVVILLTWLSSSWIFLRLMQRVLFGPCRMNILYEDLRGPEVAALVAVLAILTVIGVAPYGFFESGTLIESVDTAMELGP